MKILCKRKDGGNESSVTGYWLIEWKSLFSICLLNFRGESRNAYHTHAFNAVSWLLKGALLESELDGKSRSYSPSFKPIYTPRDCFHKVSSHGSSWVLTFRGPWSSTWGEYLPEETRYRTLTNGRIEVEET